MENIKKIKDVQKRSSMGLMPAQQEVLEIIADLEGVLEPFLNKRMRAAPAHVLFDYGRLPEAHQNQVANVLRSQLAFVNEAISCGLSGYNERELVHLAMGKLDLLGDDNVLQNVMSTDVVEIFGTDHTQRYRSFSCFALCNYSILELVTYPWYELYDRPSFVQDRIFALCNPVFAGQINYQNLEAEIAPYILQEKLTDERASFRVQEKFYALMRSTASRNSYVLSVKSITKMDTGASLAFL